jgi:predicted DNA-binding ribbon-helix-helix protein
MKSQVVKRSIVIASHKTSVSLEEPFWDGLKEIAAGAGLTLSALASKIDAERVTSNLSSAIRLYVFGHFRNGGLRGIGPIAGQPPMPSYHSAMRQVAAT